MLVAHSWQNVCLNNCLLKLAKKQSDKTEMLVYFACKYILLNGNIDINFFLKSLFVCPKEYLGNGLWWAGSGCH